MKRGTFRKKSLAEIREAKRAKSAPKKRKSPALRALRQGKKLGRSAVSKGPARDPEHLARVRKCMCLICEKKGEEPARAWGPNPTRAHHPRELFPRTSGRRISDYLAVPLCELHHSDRSPWDSLHKHNNEQWWQRRGLDPRDFIRTFSKEGAAELERIERAASPSD